MPKPVEVSSNWTDYLPVEGDDADWQDDYSFTAEEVGGPDGRMPSAEECEEICRNYEFDWGWELHKYARLNRPVRVRKVLRYTIQLGESKANGKGDGCLNWQEEPFGHTALWWTACHGNWELTRDLLDAGADPGIPDADGYTPAIVAAQEGHDECLQILLANGADAAHKMNDGDTALDKAEAYDRDDCIEVLKGEARGRQSAPYLDPGRCQLCPSIMPCAHIPICKVLHCLRRALCGACNEVIISGETRMIGLGTRMPSLTGR